MVGSNWTIHRVSIYSVTYIDINSIGGVEMTYTIEDVKRLIPEAKEPWSNGLEVHITIGHKTHGSDSDWGRALLTTRRQLELAREALEYIDQYKRGSSNPNALDGMDAITMRGTAGVALDAINKEGEME